MSRHGTGQRVRRPVLTRREWIGLAVGVTLFAGVWLVSGHLPAWVLVALGVFGICSRAYDAVLRYRDS